MTSGTRIVIALVLGIVIGAAGHSFYTRNAQVEDSGREESASRVGDRTSEPEAGDFAAERVAATLPEIPISLNYVEARSGIGYVVQFHNQSQKHLAVLVELENRTLNQRRSGPLQLAPGQMVEIGGTPEWTFVSGEKVTLKLDGHQTKAFQVP